MSRPTLKLARASKPTHPPLSLVKKALRLFRGRGVPKAVRHANARNWLASVAWLGDKHLLRGGEPKWGQPGEPYTTQVHAPRRQGAKP